MNSAAFICCAQPDLLQLRGKLSSFHHEYSPLDIGYRTSSFFTVILSQLIILYMIKYKGMPTTNLTKRQPESWGLAGNTTHL